MQLGRHPTPSQTRLLPPHAQEHDELSRLRLPYALAGVMIFVGFLIVKVFLNFGRQEQRYVYYGDDEDDDLESQIPIPGTHGAQNTLSPNSSGGVIQWNDVTTDHVGAASNGTVYYLNGHSRDDPYQTAISSLVSLRDSPHRPLPFHQGDSREDVETLRLRAIQQLIQDLHSAQYAAGNDPGDSRSRRRVEALHTRVVRMALQLQTSAHSTRPPTGAPLAQGLTEENPHTPHDEPPPYSDAVSVPLILIHDAED